MEETLTNSDIPKQPVRSSFFQKKVLMLIFMVMGFLFLIVIVAVIVMQFKDTQSSSVVNDTLSPSRVIGEPKEEYKIINGSLYGILGKENRLLVDKKNLKHDSFEGHNFSIYSFELSPNKSKILLFTEVGLSPFVVFYRDNDTEQVIPVDLAESAEWSPNSQYIAYTRRPADVGPASLYFFDTYTNDEMKPRSSVDKQFTDYGNLRWASDSASLIADFVEMDAAPMGNVIASGEAVIRIK